MIFLRDATLADEAVILEWQRHPVTRKFARNPEPPTPQEHRVWLKSKLSSDSELMIIENSVPVGVLRLDPSNSGYEVSIFIDPSKHNQGIATKALRAAREKWPERWFWAEVLPGNDASHALFRKCGYRWDGSRYVSPATSAAQ